MRNALGELYRGYGEAFWRTKNGADLGKTIESAFKAYARDDALSLDILEQSHDAFAFNVTQCRHAEFYKAPGEPDLGFLLVCTADYAIADGFDPDVQLTRTQTFMQGAPHCDFRYWRTKE